MSADASLEATLSEPAPSRWGAFGHAAFVVIWTASVISNVGTAMFDTASGWLMTSLSASPLDVSMIQVAVSLPLFLFTLPAGALADVIDSRRLLILVEVAIIAVSAILALLVSFGLASPAVLLIATFLLGVGGALSAPAWQAVTPLLVPRQDLGGAISANSVGFNLSRAVGPALGGVAIAALGIAIPFWVFCISNFGIIAALFWWRPPRKSFDGLPAERLTSAVRNGIRYAANSQFMRATLMRALAFFPFASAYWALLPLIARSQTTQGPTMYGVLLGAIGAGAIAGSFALNCLKRRLGTDQTVALGTLATAGALVLFGVAHDLTILIAACIVAGASWTIVLTVLYVSAQVALPDWVRGRGLAIFLSVIFGATTIGSAVWGQMAGSEGLVVAHLVAAAGITIAIPLTWSWKLQTGADTDLTSSMHWRAPILAQRIENNQGPVLVTIQYRVNATDRAEFLSAITEVGHERKRDGAYAWGLFEDVGESGLFVETFLIESWLELMHARERVTKADRVLEEHVHQLLATLPDARFMIASPRGHRSIRVRAEKRASKLFVQS